MQTTSNCGNLVVTKAIARQFWVQCPLCDQFHPGTANKQLPTGWGIHILFQMPGFCLGVPKQALRHINLFELKYIPY